MLSQTPINLSKVSQDRLDQEILRLGMIAELDAINLYEQLAAMTQNEKVKAILLDIAKEEKTHVGEFEGPGKGNGGPLESYLAQRGGTASFCGVAP